MMKGSSPPPCWIRKETVEEVALMPATVPLSISFPVVNEVPPFQIAVKPLVPLPLIVPPPVAQ